MVHLLIIICFILNHTINDAYRLANIATELLLSEKQTERDLSTKKDES